MKTKLVYALAGALALGLTTFSQAQDKPEAKPEGRPQGGFSPEQREKMAKELGLNPDELKNLPPQERFAKIKEATDKKIAELQKKKADGTITDDERQTLQRLEDRKKAFAEHGAGGAGGGRGNFSPEQREKMLKELGLNPDDLKDLTPEQRMAKIKEASDKKYTELEKKKADGTLTDAEKETLQHIEQRRKWMENRGGSGGQRHGGAKPSNDNK